MKITISELKQIIREEILAEKKRKKKKSVKSLDNNLSQPYHFPPNFLLNPYQNQEEYSDDDHDMDLGDIEIA